LGRRSRELAGRRLLPIPNHASSLENQPTATTPNPADEVLSRNGMTDLDCRALADVPEVGQVWDHVRMDDGDYQAYSYLRAGEDFRAFELAPEFGRVPGYAGGLTADEERRSRRLLSESMVISLHDHPVRFPLRMEETPEYNRTGRQHAAYAGFAASGMTVVFDNMMDGTACVSGNAPWRWDDVITDLGMRQADLAHQQQIMTIRTVADIDEAYRTGRVGLVFGLEAATRSRTRSTGLTSSTDSGSGRSVSRTPMPTRSAAASPRRRADRVRPEGGCPDEPAWPGYRSVALLRSHGP
jgi:hypothetical protein